MRRALVVAAAWAISTVACGPARSAAVPGGEPAAPPAKPGEGPAPAPLARGGDIGASAAKPEGPRGTFRLDVSGFEPAVVSFPERSSAKLPVVIAAHGAGDSPESQCGFFRGLLGDRGVVLCPAGPRLTRGSEGRFYPDHFALERIAFASLAALGAAFPDHVDTGALVYTGYSQGATMGAIMIAAHGAEAPRLALIEGGYAEWSLARARKYRDTGGRRVLFACGTRHCQKAAETSAGYLRSAGVDVRLVSDLATGHWYGGGVEQRVRENLEWLLEGDARFGAKER